MAIWLYGDKAPKLQSAWHSVAPTPKNEKPTQDAFGGGSRVGVFIFLWGVSGGRQQQAIFLRLRLVGTVPTGHECIGSDFAKEELRFVRDGRNHQRKVSEQPKAFVRRLFTIYPSTIAIITTASKMGG